MARNFVEANLREAPIGSVWMLRVQKFRNANLEEAILNQANLQGANFGEANFGRSRNDGWSKHRGRTSPAPNLHDARLNQGQFEGRELP